MLSPITIALMLLVGVSLGLLGSGGSILLIPILVYVEQFGAGDAVLISLAVVGVGSAFGAWLHYRKGRLHPRAAVVFAVSGSLGAIVGARFTSMVPDVVLMLMFGTLMLVVGARMQQRRRKNRGAGFRVGRCLAVGAVVGVLTGFLGVGGGFLLVPAMILVAGLDTRQAVASSLAVIAVNSLAGLGGHLWVGSQVPVESLSALVTVVAGMVAGTFLGGSLEAASIEKVFAGLVLATGAVVVAVSIYRLSF